MTEELASASELLTVELSEDIAINDGQDDTKKIDGGEDPGDDAPPCTNIEAVWSTIISFITIVLSIEAASAVFALHVGLILT